MPVPVADERFARSALSAPGGRAATAGPAGTARRSRPVPARCESRFGRPGRRRRTAAAASSGAEARMADAGERLGGRDAAAGAAVARVVGEPHAPWPRRRPTSAGSRRLGQHGRRGRRHARLGVVEMAAHRDRGILVRERRQGPQGGRAHVHVVVLHHAAPRGRASARRCPAASASSAASARARTRVDSCWSSSGLTRWRLSSASSMSIA